MSGSGTGSTSARKGFKVLICVSRELADSQPREIGCDERYEERQYVLRFPFAASADRMVRVVVKALRALGFKQRGGAVNSSMDAPRTYRDD